MTRNNRIDAYIRDLSRSLSSLPETDRREIADEIRAHLDHRAGEGKLDEAIGALGTPHRCARGFLEELQLQAAFNDVGSARTFGALVALASRRVTATAGLFVTGVFYLIAIGFAIVCVAKIVAPESAGMWVDHERDIFMLGVFESDDHADLKEVMGLWLIPFAAAVSVLSLLIAQWLGRFFIGLMLRRSHGAI